MPTLTSGISQLYDGSGKLFDGAKTLNDGVNQLKAGTSQLADETNGLPAFRQVSASIQKVLQVRQTVLTHSQAVPHRLQTDGTVTGTAFR